MELRRPLTAAAASSVLIALMFVPSASATGDAPAQTSNDQVTAETDAGGGELNLAATGSIDTTPYVLAGTAFLGVGTGLVLYARRREQLEES